MNVIGWIDQRKHWWKVFMLIFGVSAVYAAVQEPAPFLPPFLLLTALTLVFAVIGPVAAAAALRASTD